jgi:hypothetical protein
MAKAKYRGLSTAVKCAAFGRDDVLLRVMGEEQQQVQKQILRCAKDDN